MTLTPAQQEIVQSDAPFIVVNATAGSGKSRVLVERVRRLVSNGTNPQSIAVITFTRKASGELQERLEGIKLGFCGTIHGFSLSLLRRFGALIGFADPSNIVVLDEKTISQMIVDLIGDSGYKGSLEGLITEIGRCQLSAPREATKTEITAVQFNRQLFAANSTSYDSLLAHMRRLAPMLVGLTDLHHIFLDEGQDIGEVDADIFELLPIPNKLIVGDDFQSIMAFRGGSCKHLIRYADPSYGSTMFKLEQNFRSDILICEVAERLIEHNVGQLKKNIIPESVDLGRIEVHHCPSELAEIQLIAATINQCGYPPNEIAVLLRTNILVNQFKMALAAHGIPVKTRRSLAWPSDWSKCQLLLAMIADPENEHLTYRWLRVSFGKVHADKVKMESVQKMKALSADGWILACGNTPSQETLLDLLQKNSISPPSIHLVTKIWDQANCQSVRALLDAIGEIRELEQEEGSGVEVSTVHKMKGREASVCFIPACEEGHWPGRRKEDEAEYRRLFFVAFTRAKHVIHISSCSTRNNSWSGKPERQEVSRFVSEAGL